ncbi:MAG TPA: Hpt domain-containing protein, partial [Rhodocyclaceae bacterium]|nr:Hpt domain-containing protein [Rhodocyclaceae bacterium]
MFNNPVVHDREALEEFADVLLDRAPEVERDIARLKKSPGDRELVATLFRTIHNIKGDAALCKFDLAVAIAHPIETLMSRYRNHEIPFSDLLAESILLAIDRLELATESLIRQRPVDHLHLLSLVEGLEAIAQAPSPEIEPLCRKLIESVTGFSPVASGVQSKPPAAPPQPERSSPASADMHFFRSLAQQFESRSTLFRGRTMRILRLAMETNRAAGTPVDPLQLEAAVYMHDVGMMFLPESVWLKIGRLTQAEKLMLQD